ncbi:MAG: 2,3,4,5-tetrahydropyridine-2,6-dicarboxylate N-succinyltransferase [Holosporaceae bacterium]|jgi:2,3,4,5-tetrahydropyridine-2-carboxylate N-succinyltransferase|nr:2,3,4,5-tetrahydropyridine-2,6-dicarboxylate N-succinyltransferase [Holosporaceae bacterium]
MQDLRSRIEQLWDGKSQDISCVHEAMRGMDRGEMQLLNKIDGVWKMNDHFKKAILLYFKHMKADVVADGFDKIPLKTQNWTTSDFETAGFRLVPGSTIRYSAHIAKSVIVMPSFINVGAFIDEGTMIDSHVTVGSCARIGKKCHISDGVTIGGVLEPPQAMPVIIEDDCFIGAKSVVAEGVLVEEGSVLAAGTILTASTRIIDRETGEISYAKVPPYSVVAPGMYTSSSGIGICCAVIVKRADEQIRKKTSINELLRT